MFAHIIGALSSCGKDRIAWRWEHGCLRQPKGKSSSRMLVSARIEQVRCRLLGSALERR